MESKVDFKTRLLYNKRKVSIDILKTDGSGVMKEVIIGNIRSEPCTDNQQYLYNGVYYSVEYTDRVDIVHGEYTSKRTYYLKMFKVYNNGKLIYNYDLNIKDSLGNSKGVLNSKIVKSIKLPSYFAEIFVVTGKYSPACVNKEINNFLDVLKKAKGV
jgi:hypothetical protein